MNAQWGRFPGRTRISCWVRRNGMRRAGEGTHGQTRGHPVVFKRVNRESERGKANEDGREEAGYLYYL
jgi:hypothetical protein